MIHRLLLRLNEILPFFPPLVVGLAAALIAVLALWLYGRSRGAVLFCVAVGFLAVGLVVGLSGIEAPGEPLAWGQVEDVAEDFVGPAVFRRREQITAVTFVLALGLFFVVYNLAFQEKPGERSRQILEKDEVQSKALGSAHLCQSRTFRRWARPDPWGWTVQGQFWGANGQRLGKRFCLSGEDIARGVAVFGAQGSGKTQSVILPAIADRMHDGHSLVVTDVQSELQTYIQQIAGSTGHLVIIHNPSDPEHSCPINLCRWIDNVADAQTLAATLISESHDSNQFWTKSAINLVAALLLHYSSLDEILVAKLNLSQMAHDLRTSPAPGVVDLAADFVTSLESRDPKVAHNIMITAFQTGLAPWADPRIRRVSVDAGLDLIGQITHIPTVLILRCGRLQAKSFGPYLGIILRVLTARLDDVGERQPDGRLPIPVGLILEEFPALGRLDSLVHDINLMRKRRISVLIAAQSLAQFDGVYPGKGEADQLLAGLATKIVFGGCDQRTAEFFSRASGQQTLALSSISRSRGWSGRPAHDSGTASLRGRALLLPDDVIRPDRGHATIFAAYAGGSYAEQAILHASLTPFFERKDWKRKKVRPQDVFVPPPSTIPPAAAKQTDLAVEAEKQEKKELALTLEL